MGMARKRSHYQNSESTIEFEGLYNIDAEIELIKEVKDIQNELHIIFTLLEEQITVLGQAAQATHDRNGFQGDPPTSHGFGQLHRMVAEQERQWRSLQTRLSGEAVTKAVYRYLWNLSGG